MPVPLILVFVWAVGANVVGFLSVMSVLNDAYVFQAVHREYGLFWLFQYKLSDSLVNRHLPKTYLAAATACSERQPSIIRHGRGVIHDHSYGI